MALIVTFLNGEKQGTHEVFTDTYISVGRALTNQLRFGYHDARASGRHAEIVGDGQHYTLRDIGSTNGTYVNGKRVQEVVLKDGMIVEFGPGGPRLRFEIKAEKVSTTLSASTPLQTPSVVVVARPAVVETSARLVRGNKLDTALLKMPTRILAFDEVYPYKSSLKTTLILTGLGLALLGLVLFIFSTAVFAVPVGLGGLITFALGWLLAQRYIAITAKGVQRQNVFRYESIHWDKIIDLQIVPDSIHRSEYDLYIIRGEKKDIEFRPVELRDGEQLVALLAARTGRRWSKE
jgi:pSer/pThr/pTyr-binding forkhead associated (FHA) protein